MTLIKRAGGSPDVPEAESRPGSPPPHWNDEGKAETVTTNLARIPEHGHGLSVCALSGLLACVELSDICTWTLRDDDGITGQLTSAYTDAEAYARIRELAEQLDGRFIVRSETVGHRGPFVAVEAVATTGGVPVTVWTHLHDRDARDHAQQAAQDAHRAEGVALR